ncbi:hypothetical protein [Leptothoe sp. PORK10 BA2]|uniref:hypothetical protein n=1 Tax=Leptothoe sp. PORK10 BA2 TaxID=3110254 RepID=UPI002B205A8C|nr:hypothetical protein [Leptothoe sp. PORK10 BA2]MEA5463971.1 hypothetical protein [Leptothoe sp. PORK10 BA2]
MASTFQLGLSKPSTRVYHVHLLTHQEEALFGELLGENMRLNPSGQIAADEWRLIATTHQRDIEFDQWTIIPNGVRALVAVVDNAQPATYGLCQSPPKPRALSSLVAGFKAAAAKRINLVRGLPGAPVWQRGYKEQQINDRKTLERIRLMLSSQAHSAGLIRDDGEYDVSQVGHRVE